jgi:phosphatidylserine decarboxylase
MTGRILANLFIALQRALPARALGLWIYALARNRNRTLKNLLISGFVRLYKVDTSEAARPVPDGYASFNDFFTRSLRPGARPMDGDPASVISPADGRIQQIGPIRGDSILQVKGIDYSIGDLLGQDLAAANRYRDGSFVTIYLAPWNYHRVHVPAAGRVSRMAHVPGELWSVNATTVQRVPQLFARNERLVCHFEGPSGHFAVVLVGALNVGSMSTAWAGEVLPRAERTITTWHYAASDPGTQLERGAVMGQFNMGSTVIVLLPPGAGTWNSGLAAGDAVRVGMTLGRFANLASR